MEKINNRRKRSHFIVLSILLMNIVAEGQELQKSSAYPDTIKMSQPNNYVLKCFIKGDEFSSIMTTTDGYPVIENAGHRIDYATIDSLGIIYSTGVAAKNITDRSMEDINLLKMIDKNSISKIKNSTILSKKVGGLSFTLTNFPKTGNRNLLVILIDFTDRLFQIANNNFNNLMNQANYNGTGSFRDYWLQSSYNVLTVNSTINGWYHAAHNMAYYGAHSGTNNDINPRLLVQEAIDAAENAGVNFSTYDNDQDGKVDGVIIIHAGYGEEAGGGANTIWSHHWTLDSYKRTYDGVIIDDYAIVPELRNNAGSNISNIGVICHEFGHSLGLPDLYDTDISNGDSEGIGEWGLMGSGNWNNNGASPSNLCAWSKIFLNWSSPNVLSSASTISIPNSVQNNIFYRINTPNTNEYFLVENRQHVGFDNGLPGTGLAIWHINTSKTSGSHISANDVNADESLKGVDIEEADGNSDLDNSINRGDNGDLFPGNLCTQNFTDASIPNSQTYSPIVNSNKPITNIMRSDNNIRFDYLGFDPVSGTSVCSTGTTFTVNNPPSGATVSWTRSSNITFDNQPGNPKIFTANGAGAGIITATINSNCGSVTLPAKTVWVGAPAIPSDIFGIQNGWEFWSETYNDFTVNSAYEQNANQYNWVVRGGTIFNGQGTKTITYKTAKVPAGAQKTFDVSVKVGNTCGWGPYLMRSGYVNPPPGLSMFIVYPNPATTEVTVCVADATAIIAAGSDAENIEINTLEIIDIYGNRLKADKYGKSQLSARLNVSGFQKGTYWIIVNKGGEMEEKHTLVVE